MNLSEDNETDWNVDAIWQRAENPDVAPAFYIGSGIWLSIIFCIGVFCNGSVLYAYLKNSGVCIWSVPYVAAYIKVFTVSRCTLIGTIKLNTYVFGFPTKNIKYIYLIQSSKISNDLLLVLLEVCTRTSKYFVAALAVADLWRGSSFVPKLHWPNCELRLE